jgi:hypothetical protein
MISRTVDGTARGDDDPHGSSRRERIDQPGRVWISGTPRRLVLDLSAVADAATVPARRPQPAAAPELPDRHPRSVEGGEHPRGAHKARPGPRGSCITPWPSAAPGAYAAAPQTVLARKKPSAGRLFVAVMVTLGFGLGLGIAVFAARYLPHLPGLR